MIDITIQQISIKDVYTLQHIGRATFIETFTESNTKENLEAYLTDKFNINTLLQELKNPHSQFYLAYHNNTCIGYLKINLNQAQTEYQNKHSLEIERIYILKKYFGKSVGQLLFEKAHQIALENISDFLWLGVWEENQRAIHFYTKNKLVAFDKHQFKLGDDLQTDIMKLELNY
jgi:ribosomal protein S18 acetylase RimI-like enzyme